MKSLKTIFKIAGTELRTLFYSPIAWLLLILFTIQSSLAFTDQLDFMIRYLDPWRRINLTERLFTRKGSWSGSLLPAIQGYLFLYIPLLAMGLISREMSSGSIKLLQSSPLTSLQIVVGKFLSMMFFGLLLILILALQLATGSYAITSLDIPLVISGLIGLYLLLCAYSAIGLLMSSLSAYQVIAAISTLVLLALLNYIGEIGEKIRFLRGISYYLRLKNHSDQFIDGLISTKNLVYFTMIIILFLGLTILKLESERSSKPRIIKLGISEGFILTCFGIIYISSVPVLIMYFDMTTNKTQTLSSNTLDIIKKFERPVQIHTYTNILGPYSQLGIPEQELEDADLFEGYQRFMPGLRNDYTYFYDSSKYILPFRAESPGRTDKQIAIQFSRAEGFDFNKLLSPEEIRRKIDLMSEGNQFVRQLQSGNKKVFLRAFEKSTSYSGGLTNQPTENEVANALKRLLVVPPKIIFLTGNDERSIDQKGDNSYFHATIQLDCRGSLINRGFDVDTLNILKEDIHLNIAALVVADPNVIFSPVQLEKLFKYIDQGGNLLIAGDPGRQSILNPLLQRLNVQMQEGELFRQNNENGPDFIMAGFSRLANSVSPVFMDFLKEEDSVVFPGAVGLQFQQGGPFMIQPVLLTRQNTWNKMGVVNKDTGAVNYEPEKGDLKQSWPVALALTRNIFSRQQRIMVLGDADFMTEKEMERDNVGSVRIRDLDFSAATFKWFSYGSFPVDVDHPDTHHEFRIGLQGVFKLKILFLFLFPALLFIAGLLLLLRRKIR